MTDYEKDIKDLISQMHRQQGGGSMPGNMDAPSGPSGQIDTSGGMGTDQSPHLMNEGGSNSMGSVDQSPLNPVNSVRPMGTPVGVKPQVQNAANIAAAPAHIPAPVEGGCAQCGMVHPPIAPGTRCPMAPVKVKNGAEEKVVDVNRFLTDLKNIIVSQAEMKKVTDIEKLFKNIIVEVTKYLEDYSE